MGAARINITIAIGVLIVLSGCARPDAGGRSPGHDEVLTVQEAIDAGTGQVRVRGYVLIAADQVTRLCTGLAGSYPPQCGAPALVVQGLAAEAIPHRESAQGIVWGGEITLRGNLAAGVLTVG
ncbi:hypothetical protein [Actinoplanes regularis]|uniref:Uncharacterized protein n=1 Tax=Actinoplanes regularis TaxID=52697 RepID=A0A238ZKA9_9ACTN|nr:hypothetical protein [Actinoplanes regularis]GIE87667.1 hypothetical protein Are01nite_41470 [Actinoplanes regularis]SNR83113.1 hypothetical protein SAMN06264365_10657 [Actinoplanes regularis]